MRAEFLRGKRKEDSKTGGKRKGESKTREKIKEELGLRGIRQRKGQLWAREEEEDIYEANQDQELKQATNKEMKRNHEVANQENNYTRERDDLDCPWRPAIFASTSNPKCDNWDFYGSPPANSRKNSNLKSCGGFSWTNVLESHAQPTPYLAPTPKPTPYLAPTPTPSPSSASPLSQTPHFAEHTPRRLSVIKSTSDVQLWDKVRL